MTSSSDHANGAVDAEKVVERVFLTDEEARKLRSVQFRGQPAHSMGFDVACCRNKIDGHILPLMCSESSMLSNRIPV